MKNSALESRAYGLPIALLLVSFEIASRRLAFVEENMVNNSRRRQFFRHLCSRSMISSFPRKAAVWDNVVRPSDS
jgi:hypothetical protein